MWTTTATRIAAAAMVVTLGGGLWLGCRTPSLYSIARRNLEATRQGDVETLCRYASEEEQALFCSDRSVRERFGQFLERSFAKCKAVGGVDIVHDQPDMIAVQQLFSTGGAISVGTQITAYRTPDSAICPMSFWNGLAASFQALAKPIDGEVSPERILRGMKVARPQLEAIGINRLPGREGEAPITWDEAIVRQETRIQIVKSRKS